MELEGVEAWEVSPVATDPPRSLQEVEREQEGSWEEGEGEVKSPNELGAWAARAVRSRPPGADEIQEGQILGPLVRTYAHIDEEGKEF